MQKFHLERRTEVVWKQLNVPSVGLLWIFSQAAEQQRADAGYAERMGNSQKTVHRQAGELILLWSRFC